MNVSVVGEKEASLVVCAQDIGSEGQIQHFIIDHDFSSISPGFSMKFENFNLELKF